MATIDLNHETICINPTDDLTLYDKNNIMSRIEKFLFAICSLDSSDLPVPLSRIEELYYCLVTGDTPPTFEPLSRAEKFLMACLGIYDINKLPEPLSRSEVLLKKIATGDSNLEDVDNLQSKYEFLLAYIIQNGGIGDFDEYDLNTQFSTLYNTKERPIKSAILKGNTLVNLQPKATREAWGMQLNDAPIPNNCAYGGFEEVLPKLKPSTKYLIKFNKVLEDKFYGTYFSQGTPQTGGIIKDYRIVTTNDVITDDKTAIHIYRRGEAFNSREEMRNFVLDLHVMIIEYQEGMENWDIPYFEGMQSVRMPVLTTTGKNILNINENNFGEFLVWGDNGSTPVEYIENEKAFYTPTHRMLRLQNLKPNKTYTLSFDVKRVSSGNFCAVTLFMGYSEEIGWVESENNTYIRKHYTFATTENVTKIEVTFYNTVYFKNLQLVEGTITEYEPFKSNILTSGKTFTQSMFEQGSFKENTPFDTKPYDDIKINLSENSTYYSNRIRTITTHKVIPGASYKVKINDGYGIFIGFCKNGLYTNLIDKSWSTYYNFTFTVPTDCDEMFFALRKIDDSDITVEDYPAIGLEIRQEVTLRGIGEVKDELNLVTGELTQRIGEIVLDGDGYWNGWGGTQNLENISTFQLRNVVLNSSSVSVNSVADKFATYKNATVLNTILGEGLALNNSIIFIRIEKTKLSTDDVNGLKKYLQNNPITLQYQLEEDSVKTVDLSVVDQDGNDTKLSTFNDITHVTLSSEGLIPEAELEVATKNEEDLEDSSVYTVHTLSEEFNTLYNTEEKPVKSAILKGQTLVNLASEKNTSIGGEGNITCVLPYKVDKITVYFLDPTYNKFQYFEYDSEGNYIRVVNSYIPSDRVIFISLNSTTIGKIGYLNPDDINTSKNIVAMYGDTRDIKITKYFEGVQSVKMPVLMTTGKNLFDYQDFKNTVLSGGATTKYPINLKPNTTYTFSDKTGLWNGSNGYYIDLSLKDENDVLIAKIIDSNSANRKRFTFTTSNSSEYYLFMYRNNMDKMDKASNNFQIELGSVATSYEPYKTNILTTSEEVELHGIGDVKDELNLLTGELTERIGEINTASMNTSYFSGYVLEPSGLYRMSINIENLNINGSIKCDKLSVVPFIDSWNLPYECISIYSGGILLYLKDTPTVESFVNKAIGLDLIIQYVKVQNSVKTVDLSVVDQDGNDTKLSTFNDITHVTLSSEGLIPEAELEVAEKVPEIAASILTISREQEVIDSATNKQSENVDATMIATTEIYEGLL